MFRLRLYLTAQSTDLKADSCRAGWSVSSLGVCRASQKFVAQRTLNIYQFFPLSEPILQLYHKRKCNIINN